MDRAAAYLSVSAEVAAALADGAPVVALESTIIAHGLPRPQNLEVARDVERIIREAGAVPATIAVIDGVVNVGLDDHQLRVIATSDAVLKASRRDLPMVVARGRTAATTVAATSALAAGAGIGVFATGGLGGVHRGDPFDESADLTTLAQTDIVVVCSGVKSILDVRATLERLESYGIGVVGLCTDAFPGFYLADSGHRLDWRVESAEEAAAVARARRRLPGPVTALIVANPIPVAEQLDRDLHDRILSAALADARQKGITQAGMTPFLLERFHTQTGGASIRANSVLIRRNARTAAEVAIAMLR